MSQWRDFLVGKTLTSIEEISGPKGEDYIRFHFGDTYYEFLSHFSPSEHKMAIAQQALEELYKGPYGGPTSYTAGQALKKMETFDR